MKDKLSLHLITIRVLLVINIAVVLGLWITGFLSGLNPEKWGWFSLMGYAFPFFILATILFFIPWLFIRKRCILVSFLGLLVAYYPVTLYCPINPQLSETSKSEKTLKLMSFNVLNWGKGYISGDLSVNKNLTDEDKYHIMVDFFKSIDADIVAVQEGSLISGVDTLKNIYHYNDTIRSTGENNECVLLLSKYPITRKENLKIPSKGNGAGAFWINLKGKEIIIIAAHLESMKISISERERFSTIIHGDEESSNSVKSTSKTIFSKILLASKIRAQQSKIIAQFINGHIGVPIIVMGDFNDIPQSYTHDLICDQLKDCYREKGLGPGYSFKHFGMRVRIDNILCSKEFNTISCEVNNNIDLSDHLPIVATLSYKP